MTRPRSVRGLDEAAGPVVRQVHLLMKQCAPRRSRRPSQVHGHHGQDDARQVGASVPARHGARGHHGVRLLPVPPSSRDPGPKILRALVLRAPRSTSARPRPRGLRPRRPSALPAPGKAQEASLPEGPRPARASRRTREVPRWAASGDELFRLEGRCAPPAFITVLPSGHRVAPRRGQASPPALGLCRSRVRHVPPQASLTGCTRRLQRNICGTRRRWTRRNRPRTPQCSPSAST